MPQKRALGSLFVPFAMGNDMGFPHGAEEGRNPTPRYFFLVPVIKGCSMLGATFCHAIMEEELFVRKTLGPVGLDSAGDCKLLFGAAFLLLLGVSMVH